MKFLHAILNNLTLSLIGAAIFFVFLYFSYL